MKSKNLLLLSVVTLASMATLSGCGKVDVEEDITINWIEYGHHGIYKFTPEWYKYTSKNGKTVRRKSEISNLRAEIPPYTYNPDIEYNYGSGIEYTNDINVVESY